MPLVNELNDAGAIHRRLENLRIGFVMYAITLYVKIVLDLDIIRSIIMCINLS